MNNSFQKQQISITIDSKLLEEIDGLTGDRAAAIEEGLRLWRKQHIESQLRHFYQNRSEADVEFEREWVEATQEQAIAAWDKFPWNPSGDKND